ncbi:MAG: ATP-binding cassette domain-containing protein [Paracoccaceae bacterium]
MTTPLLSVGNVTRRYRLARTSFHAPRPVLTAVSDASFTLDRSRTLGVVGESGSGKSTLARMVMAFERPDEGRVLFEGQDLAQLAPSALRRLRQRFQMVFQDPYGSLDPRRTVANSIAEPLRAIGAGDHAAKVAQALDQVGLRAGDGEKYPHEFSGGQRQRIAIARAIVTRPALLVADEAVSALDVSVQAQILNLLMDLQDELGLAILFISHDLAVVGSLCDDIIVMKDGHIVEAGPASKVLSAPSRAYTKTLLQAAEI